MVNISSEELKRSARLYRTNADACRALGISAHTFRRLCEVDFADSGRDQRVREQFRKPAVFDEWAVDWRLRMARAPVADSDRRRRMRSVNPAYIPRNHRVQQAIDSANIGDFDPLDRLLKVVSQPYEDHTGYEEYACPPQPDEVVHQTFCGT